MTSAIDGEKPAAAEWVAGHISRQVRRTVVVTGGNSGLGLETVRALAGLGAKVIMTARDRERGERALEQLLAEQPAGTIELRELDLADLDSVHRFAEGVEELDVLVNNAGVMMPPLGRTAQGFEQQFGVNHLAHFALTGLLLDKLALADEDPRVVTVSSGLHRRGRIHFDNLHGEHGYSPSGYYSQSKLANVVFALELHRRLRAAGSPIKSVLAHPGYAATNLQSAGPSGVARVMLKVTNRLMAQDAAMGALPQVYAAAGADVRGGQFWGPDGRGESKGYPTLVEPLDSARDRELGQRLWAVSEELTGVRIPLAP